MERSAIKSFAIWARRHLQEQVTVRLKLYGITAAGLVEAQAVAGGLIVAGETLDAADAKQYELLREQLKGLMGGCAVGSKRYGEAVAVLVDEVAYTWFNRLAALRYMEVNGYLQRRVLSSGDEKLVDPEILRSVGEIAELGDLPGLDRGVLEGSRAGNGDEFLYRRLLGLQCAALGRVLPFLFESGMDYTALLLPGNLLNQDSIVRRFVKDIPEGDWQDATDSENGVEIIGWLYQFYISERKDEVIGAKGKVAARDIPAATQLFTPHWIVRYMVENSLGRLWLESHPESGLRSVMKYYLESPADGASESGVPDLQPQDLTVMDPACGSGHILVYAFDLLFEIYREQGYREREIPGLILAHNLYGLDIDARAVQLASFAVLMKARAKNSRLFRDAEKVPALNVVMVKSTKALLAADVETVVGVGFGQTVEQLSFLPSSSKQLGLGDVLSEVRGESAGIFSLKGLNRADWLPLLEAFEEAENLGSLITPPEFDGVKLLGQVERFALENSLFGVGAAADGLRAVVQQAELLRRRYWVVVANPPFMGSKRINPLIQEFLKENYSDVKSDVFAAFIVRNTELTMPDGQLGFMSPFVWMFLSSYEKLRKFLLSQKTIISLVKPSYTSFFDSAIVPLVTFVLKNSFHNVQGTFVDLGYLGSADSQPIKLMEAITNPNCDYLYHAKAADFGKIPGSPIAYWASQRILDIFSQFKLLEEISKPCLGMTTGSNDTFVRQWSEVSSTNLYVKASNREEAKNTGCRWFPYNKGGEFRRWYGNNENVVNWKDDGLEVIASGTAYPRSKQNYFRKCVTWSFVSSSYFGVRYSTEGFIFDVGGSCVFPNVNDIYWITSFLCSGLSLKFMNIMNPMLNFQVGNVASLPVLNGDHIRPSSIAQGAIEISRKDWDNSETSWDFQTNPLLRNKTPSISQAFTTWQEKSETAFQELKQLEEENNCYWIEAYGLQSELTPQVPDDQITIRRADLQRDIKSFISYAIGCTMGRYSLDTPGLIHAGQPFDPSRHTKFPSDPDAILPITDQAYFDDDIVTRFIEFVETAYSKATLTENLDFIANALQLKTSETARDRIRRYFATEFITDHIKTYKKRPIYWLFTSKKPGSKKVAAFSALVYLHRYTPDTIGRIRTDYILELQVKIDREIDRHQTDLTTATPTTHKALTKQLKTLQEQQLELRTYQAQLQTIADQRMDLDLDDGVAYNYTRFKGIIYEGPDLKMADLEAKAQWKHDLLKQTVNKSD